MLKVYGSPLCPDCVACKANFDLQKVEYEYCDITGSMKTLKEFLDLRDHNATFVHSKEIGDVGIPACVKEDGTVFLDWEGYMKDLGLEVTIAKVGQACGLDGKGC